MKSNLCILAIGLFAVSAMYSCTKNATPTPPVHDTITVTKTDTIKLPPPPPDTASLRNGLVLYLPFSGSFADSSGNGNTVAGEGGATLDYDMHGYANSAFKATGAGERLIVSNNGAYKVDTAFSISFDFMMTSNAYFTGGYDFSGLQVFMSIVDTSNGNGPTFDVGMIFPGAPQLFGFAVNAATPGTACGSSVGTATVVDTTNLTPQLGSWYNAVCTFTKGTSSVYINGQLMHTATNPNATDAVFCSNAKFVVGGWWNGGNSGLENLRGKLDEVRMYNRTLTAKEITYLARNFQPGSVKTNPTVRTR
ncbi:MAG TPA: LamG domain-containing protein [Puia sp.]|nr:LamG domain-containing protein [Puia sp.]